MVKVLQWQSIKNSDPAIVPVSNIDIALRLQKTAGATGSLTFQLLNARTEVLVSKVIRVDSMEIGTHWRRFTNIPVNGFLPGQKLKIQIKCSHNYFPNKALFWRSGMLHTHEFVYHRGSPLKSSALTLDVSCFDNLTGNVYKYQQLEDKCGVMLSSSWTSQEFVIAEH